MSGLAGAEQVDSFFALGTVWHITTPLSNSLSKKESKQLEEFAKTFGHTYSRFDASSLLSRLNTEKKLLHPSKEMKAMLQYALDLYKKTNGLFNISIGAQLERDGYGMTADNASKVSPHLLDDITIGQDEIRIAEYVRLDFGGFGKGWLVDSIHELLVKMGKEDHIVNGGGDIRVSGSTKRIYIENPLHEGYALGSVNLFNEAFAASSNLKRKWQTIDGVQKVHIIHPKNNKVGLDVVQVCTRAKTCLQADSYATVLFLQRRQERLRTAQDTGLAHAEVFSNGHIESTPDFALLAD
jgi:thiamine biosynthesis lipoprotein